MRVEVAVALAGRKQSLAVAGKDHGIRCGEVLAVGRDRQIPEAAARIGPVGGRFVGLRRERQSSEAIRPRRALDCFMRVSIHEV